MLQNNELLRFALYIFDLGINMLALYEEKSEQDICSILDKYEEDDDIITALNDLSSVLNINSCKILMAIFKGSDYENTLTLGKEKHFKRVKKENEKELRELYSSFSKSNVDKEIKILKYY